MPKINILTLLPGDSQFTLIDKINYSFDQILTAGGGPIGKTGQKGETGPIGPRGKRGLVGPQGNPGTRWFVNNTTGPTAGNPRGIPVKGDYWLESNTKEIYVYGPSGSGLEWIDTGESLRTDQIFSSTGSNWNIGTSSYDSDVSYYGQDDPENFSLLLSDWGVDSSSNNYTGYTGYGLNSEKSKLKISTDFSSQYVNLISFGRAALDSANSLSPTFSNTHNPNIKWSINSLPGSTAGTPNIWDIQFYNPIGNWDLITTGGNIGLSSKLVNKIETSALTGGTLVNISGNGFFQVLPSGSTASSLAPYFSVNPTGAAIKTVPTLNNFTVKGSVAISENDSYSSYQFGNGILGVETGLRVGATGFNPYNIPAGVTGPIPKVLISGQNNSTVFQVRLDQPGATSNSWMSWGGNGNTYPYSSARNILTQEYAISSTGSIPTGTVFSGYYHGAGNNTYGTGGSPTQFIIESRYAQGSYIQTAGLGKYLNLFANPATGGSDDRVNIGANNYEMLRVYGQEFFGSTTGGVKINGSTTNSLINSTKLSIEDGGMYIGPVSSTPYSNSRWAYDSCDNAPLAINSRQKIIAGGFNGTQYENQYDTNPLNPPTLPITCFTPIGGPLRAPNVSRAISVSDYDLYTGNRRLFYTVNWNNGSTGGQTTIGLRSTNGIPTTVPAALTGYGPDVAQLFVFGNISLTGDIRSSGGIYVPSSRSLKEDIKPLNAGLSDLMDLKPVSFTWIESGKADIGFIAEDIFEILPEASDINEEGVVTGYEPTKLIPMLVKGIQELTDQVESLKKEIEILKSR